MGRQGLIRRRTAALPRLALCLLALPTAIGADAGDAGTVVYPANPAAGAGVVCVSDSGIHCFDEPGGAPAWQALAGVRTLEPVIAGGRVLAASSQGLYAFDATSGERLWHRPGNGLVFPPTVAGDTAFASDEHGALVAIDLASGTLRWRRSFPGWSYPPAVAGEVLVTGGREGILRGLDRASGRTRWRLELDQELVYRPAATPAGALVTTFAGTVLTVNADGEVVWRVRDGVASATPAVADGRAYLPGLDGRLRARRTHDGALLWTRDLGAAADGPGHAARGQLGVTTRDGEVLIVDTADGEPGGVTTPPGSPVGSPVPGAGGAWLVPARHRDALAWHPVAP
ncbi:MAG: PQQ-binding-like beta-propeller repeat protein [Halofilum sp. (in: g-proteobacteria)]|nr:PQQ-binding-like beta-propeller repeat protein [Halofilum sp. (in: g-proteobacteria)]